MMRGRSRRHSASPTDQDSSAEPVVRVEARLMVERCRAPSQARASEDLLKPSIPVFGSFDGRTAVTGRCFYQHSSFAVTSCCLERTVGAGEARNNILLRS